MNIGKHILDGDIFIHENNNVKYRARYIDSIEYKIESDCNEIFEHQMKKLILIPENDHKNIITISYPE